MQTIVNIPAVQIMIGTLPIIVLLVLLLVDQKKQFADIRLEIRRLHERIDALTVKVGDLAERISKIEGKIEGHHVVLEN